MSFQELCEKFKKEICPNCALKNQNYCNICKTPDGVKCYAYESKTKKERKYKPAKDWQRW